MGSEAARSFSQASLNGPWEKNDSGLWISGQVQAEPPAKEEASNASGELGQDRSSAESLHHGASMTQGETQGSGSAVLEEAEIEELSTAEQEAEISWLVDEFTLSMSAYRQLGRLFLWLALALGLLTANSRLGLSQVDILGPFLPERTIAGVGSFCTIDRKLPAGTTLARKASFLEKVQLVRLQTAQILRYLEVVAPCGLRIRQLSLNPPAMTSSGLSQVALDLEASLPDPSVAQTYLDSLRVVVPSAQMTNLTPASAPSTTGVQFAIQSKPPSQSPEMGDSNREGNSP